MFYIHSVEGGYVPSFEYMPVSAITPKVGQALVMSSGNLVVCSGTTKPTYISMCERAEACSAGDIIPVIRVTGDIIFETKNSAAFTSVKPGSKVTVSADGLEVTATSTDGVAEVISFSDTAVGSAVRVRFA